MKLGREGGWVYKKLGEEKNMIKIYVISLNFNKKLKQILLGKISGCGESLLYAGDLCGFGCLWET